MALEERNDLTFQGWKSVDRVRPDAAVRAFRAEPPTAEHADHRFEHRSIPLVLVHVEDGMELPPAGRTGVGVPMYRHREAAFAVDESDDPTRIELEYRRRSGFLLIVRTGRIFTAHASP